MLTLGVCCETFLTGCGSDEVELDAWEFNDPTNNFVPADDDMSLEATLRREVYAETGSYLLFNDTIQHYFVGTDFNGDSCYFTEVVDMQYSVGDNTSANINSYTYDLLLTDSAKQVAVDYMRENILPHLTGDCAPFSWLLVDKIKQRGLLGTTIPEAAAGQRCTAVSCYSIPTLTETSKVAYTRQVLVTIVSQVIMNKQVKFTPFTDICDELYGANFDSGGSEASNTRKLREAGFITKGMSGGSSARGVYPTMAADLAAYAKLAVGNTPEQVDLLYGAYPLVMRKYNILREILEEVGYVF